VQVRGVLRRAGFDRVTSAAGLITVALSLVLVAAGPIYSDAVTIAALRRTLDESPTRDSTITIEATTPGDDYETLDGLVTATVRRATSSTGAEVLRRTASESYGYRAAPDAPSDDLVDLVVLRSLEGIDDHATIVAGRWPGDDASAIAVDVRAAERLELDVGDTIDLAVRRDPSSGLRTPIAGLYVIDDPTESFWASEPRLADGVNESTRFRTWSFVAPAPMVIGATTNRVEVGWFVRPDLGSAGLDDVELLRGQVAGLAGDLAAAADAALGAVRPASELDVETGLPAALRTADRALTVTRSSVLAITLQLSVLAGYALALTAGLIAEGRRTEFEVLRVRGASPLQMLRRSAAEATILTLPAALLAPRLASALAGVLNRAGPLSRNNLIIDPRPIRSAYALVVVAAILTICLLAAPTFRLARVAQRTADGRREQSRSTFQRAGVDLVIAMLAALTIWQLSTLGAERTASIRGRFGVDPLLVVAPSLGLFAGAFLALRVIPGLARLLERSVRLTRTAVPALAGWYVARRPARYARAALLLIIAIALGVFTTTYESTWERSQRDQATQQVGADLRVEPNRRIDDSIADFHLLSAYRGVEGVRTAMAVTRRSGVLPNSELPAQFVALDAAVAEEVVRTRADDGELAVALAQLAADRPTPTALPLPSNSVRLDLEILIRDPALEGGSDDDQILDGNDVAPDTVDAPVEEPFQAQMFVVFRDADGLMHRRRLGEVTAGTGPARLTVDLVLDDAVAVAATAPLSLVDIELRAGVPAAASRTVFIELASLDAVDPTGRRTALDTPAWGFARTSFGSLDRPSRIAPAGAAPDAMIVAEVETGASRFGAVTTYGFRPAAVVRPSSYSVVVSRSWFEANDREIGDTIALPGLADVTARIAGTVDSFVTVDPSRAAVVLIDLPTLQSVNYELGRPIDPIDEAWLAAVKAPAAIAHTLEQAPYEATSTLGRDTLADRLLSDPPAVGTIGALTLGFVAAAAFAVVGFLVAATVSARDRAAEFALLRALGLSARQLAAWTLLEQAALVGLCLVLGTAVGLGLAALVLPAISLTAAGGEVFPVVEIVHPWTTIVFVQSVVLGGLVASVLGINIALRRLAVARHLRAGPA
jgi:hypothetical protein